MTRQLTLPLDSLGQHDLAIAGGKGANLGELIRAGLPVPAGFVVTTEAYAAFVDHHQLNAVIATSLRDSDAGAGRTIREAFEQASMPETLAGAVVEAWHRLGAGPVAVRSSATAEDLPQAAFAGQQDTYLNIVSVDGLLDAVRRCWASLWTDRAILYRQRQSIDQASVQLAVVVQTMIPAEAAGVMLTANPITGERGEVVIDATPGLGEALVSGLVTPDHYRLDKRARAVLEQTLGRRERIVYADKGGGTHDEPDSATNEPVLGLTELRTLLALGQAIETHFGRPMDVEWTLVAGQFAIVQARPMTALPEPLAKPSRLSRILSSTLADVFWIRPYPLDESTWVQVIGTGVLNPMLSLVGLHVSLEDILIFDDGICQRFNPQVRPRLSATVVGAPFRIAVTLWRYDPRQAGQDPDLLRARERASQLEQLDFGRLTAPEIDLVLQELIALAGPLIGQIRQRYMLAAGARVVGLVLLLTLIGQRRLLTDLLSGVDSDTLQANLALERLAAEVRRAPGLAAKFRDHDATSLLSALPAIPEGRGWLVDFQTFMDRYGHRESTLATTALATWKDAPEVVLGMLKGMIGAEPVHNHQTAAWESARGQVMRHPLLRVGPVRAGFDSLLTGARALWTVRENSHYDLARIQPGMHRLFMALGQRLMAARALDAVSDIFHLRYVEVQEALRNWPLSPETVARLRTAVARRRQRRAELGSRPVIDPRLYQNRAQTGPDTLLQGAAGSPGQAEGPVKVIHDMSEFDKLGPGDVLVAPYTNPAWTPLFQRASAVVVDSGSSASHAAIVAREYGIPAVMGVVDGTRLLVDGQRIRVNGSTGIVSRG